MANAPCVWQDVTGIVAREFVEEVEEGVVPNDGIKGTLPVAIDASKTERELGVEFMRLEEQVKSVVGHYLELKRGRRRI
jgi:hypothetical protein